MKTEAVVTVLGADKTGIVAEVACILRDGGANIEDIRQNVLKGVFSMTMMIEIDEDVYPFESLHAQFAEASDRMGVQIVLQRADVFAMMHRI